MAVRYECTFSEPSLPATLDPSAERSCFPQQGRFVPSLACFPECAVQLLDEDVTVPIISDPDDGVTVLYLSEARRMKLDFVVAGRRVKR